MMIDTTCQLHLIEVQSRQGVLFAGNDHHTVATDDSGSKQRHKPEERELVGARNANHPHRLMNLQCGAI